MNAIDPAICPLCGSTHMCAMEVAKAAGRPLERCWCVDAVFTSEVLQALPEDAKGKACICADCSSKFKTLEK